MCPKPFSWAKNKVNFFPTGSREDRSQREWHLKTEEIVHVDKTDDQIT